MKRTTLACLIGATLVTTSTAFAAVDATATLPNAKPGECYAKVIIPAKFETQTEEVVVREASEKIDVVPARYEWTQEKVLVQDASYKLIPVPAVYETVTEKVEISPSSTSWTLTTANGRSKKAGASLVAYAKGAGLPSDAATPGQCYVEYYQPAKYKTETQTVVKKDESETVSVIPAKYEWVEEQVLIKDASTKVIQVPAVYGTVTEKIMVAPATTMWKKGHGPKQRIDNTTGEIMCLVEVPAKYKTVTKKVVKTPASTKTIEIPAKYATQKVRKLIEPAREVRKTNPAEYSEISKRVKVSEESVAWYLKGEAPSDAGKPTGNKLCLREIPAKYQTVTKRVLKTPASSKKIEIPAKYKTVKVRKMVEAAHENRKAIPARTETVSKRVKIEDERLEWRSVLCDTNTTVGLIKRVQTALKDRGFNPGPLDGNLGTLTLTAIDRYQRKNGMARGGLTMATLKSLDIQP
ncbi:MAG TPA: peptidoglycan-binding protein [Gammaproteobacteria bacterium]|nr:peptidoglycan-binding protein [Gammaproteobacteria bacterium]